MSSEVMASPLSREEVKRVIEEETKKLGERGRIVVRPSGTEPLLRVMVEGEDETEINGVAERIADVVRRQLA